MTDDSSKSLDASRLAPALVSGIHRVIGDQETLNRINVFPVPDGDTGTNLSLSLGSALAVLEPAPGPHLGQLLARLADALLDGARGNSGAIVAQFFQGLSDAAGDAARFTAESFAAAVAAGRDYAHDALAKPREGTILSTISAFAASIEQQVFEHGIRDFGALLPAASRRTDAAVEATTGQLAVLQKAGVVDAGARGFAELVGGIADYIATGVADPPPDPELFAVDEFVVAAGDGDDSAFRYCIECLVTGDDIDRRKLRESLAVLGDSLVLAGTRRKARIHIHVNEPEAVFRTAADFGTVSGQKADDMHRQAHSSHATGRRFAVIVDSAADIADADLERYDIHVVPLRIQFGERGYLDKVGITATEFYAELASNPQHPTTSQPAPGDFRRQFQFLASHYADVLSINVTSRASGTAQAAEAAAERIDARGRVHVLDTRNASVGQGLLAAHAAACAEAGKDVATTRTELEELIVHTRTYALMHDLRFAVRGGRVPAWVGRLAGLFRLATVIRTVPDGRIATAGFFVGRRRRLERFAAHIARRLDDDVPVRIGIAHAVCEDDAVRLAAELRARIGSVERLDVTELGTALGVHTGPGALVVATQPVLSR